MPTSSLLGTSIISNTRRACTCLASLSKPDCPKGAHDVCGSCELALRAVYLVLSSHTRQGSQLKLGCLALLASASPVLRSLGFWLEAVHSGLIGEKVGKEPFADF